MVTFRVTSRLACTVRRDVHVHADVDVLELRIDQRVDADAADAGLERTGGHRHPVADLQRRLLLVEARICGLWMILVSVSVNRKLAVACGMVTRKSVASGWRTCSA